jgi:hypothetical protein
MNIGKPIRESIKMYVMSPIKTIVSDETNNNLWDKLVKEILTPVRLITSTSIILEKNDIG